MGVRRAGHLQRGTSPQCGRAGRRSLDRIRDGFIMPPDPGHEEGAMVTGGSLPLSARAQERPAAPGFDDLFRSKAAYVSRTVRYLGVREADVEDAAQEVFVVVHRRL